MKNITLVVIGLAMGVLASGCTPISSSERAANAASPAGGCLVGSRICRPPGESSRSAAPVEVIGGQDGDNAVSVLRQKPYVH